MIPDLKGKIESLVETLREAGKHRLANCIEKNWHKTALAYSRELNIYQPRREMEPELSRAFEKELARLEIKNSREILDSIEKRRILQTAPHLAATEFPRFFCLNWLASLGVPDNESYVVAMYSGIPFSNHTRPGRWNRKENSVNLFPSSLQDDLVFRSKIPEKLGEAVKTLPAELKKLLPEAKVGRSYTKWALGACANIERKILGKENLVYLDINEVVANYMDEIKNNKGHPMNKVRELKETNLFLSFVPLLLNHFKCFGSFAQVEYLPVYQGKLAALPFLQEYNIEQVPTANLTTGVFPEHPDLYPADIISGEDFRPNPEILFGELLIPMTEALLSSYFTGDKRKTDARK